MAAKRLRAAPTRLARALFWLGRSSKSESRGSGDSWQARYAQDRCFGLASILRISRPFVALSVSPSFPSHCTNKSIGRGGLFPDQRDWHKAHLLEMPFRYLECTLWDGQT